MLFSLLKHYLDIYVTDTARKVSQSLYFFTAIFYCVESCFPRLWGMGIADTILYWYNRLLFTLICCAYIMTTREG